MRLPLQLGALPATLLLLLSSTLVIGVHGAEEADSGELKIEYTKTMTCSRPTKDGDMISVNYRGTLQSTGKEFDASYNRGVPFSFKLGAHKVIKGWDQGLLDMCIGEGRKLIIPPNLGYGNRGVGAIPGGSTLIFETELMGIKGVKAEEPSPTSEVEAAPTSTSVTTSEVVQSTASSTPTAVEDEVSETAAPTEGAEAGPKTVQATMEGGQCELLGPFALIVQGVLGALALLSLVFKRWRERPRRPLKIWAFDASKQVVGSILLHILNLAMSMVSSGDLNAARTAQAIAESAKDENGQMPNPCSFYLLNLAIDVSQINSFG